MRGGYLHARVTLAAALARSGELDGAHTEMAQIKHQRDDFTPELIDQPYQPEHFAEIVDGLRLADLEN
jgi:hypothetical protein